MRLTQEFRQWFEGAFGPLVRIFGIIKFPLHIISFLTGSYLLFRLQGEQMEILGLSGYFWAIPLAGFLALVGAVIVEALHFYVPDRFFRMLFEFDKQVIRAKWPNWVMFAFLGLLIFGLTKASGLMSAGGGKQLAEDRYEEPAPTDISQAREALGQDTAALNGTYQEVFGAINLTFDAKQDSVKAFHNGRIGGFQAALRGHQREKARGNQWAQSWIDRRNREISSQRAALSAALATVEAQRLAALAPERENKANERRAIIAAFNGYRADVAAADQLAVEQVQAQHATRLAYSENGGWGVVYLILGLSCLSTFYHVISDHPEQRLAYRHSRRLSRAWAALTGIFADKAEHQVKRLEKTKEAMATRNEARPFSLPSGRNFFQGFSLGLLFFAAIQLPEKSGSFAVQLGIADLVNHPYDKFLFGLAIVLCVLAFYDRKNKSVGKVSTGPKTVADSTGKSVEDEAATTVAETPETVVRQQSEAEMEVVADSALMDVDDKYLKRMRDRLLKYYERQFTSATEKGRDSNATAFAKESELARKLGFNPRPGKKNKRVSVKRDGKPKFISFPELIID